MVLSGLGHVFIPRSEALSFSGMHSHLSLALPGLACQVPFLSLPPSLPPSLRPSVRPSVRPSLPPSPSPSFPPSLLLFFFALSFARSLHHPLSLSSHSFSSLSRSSLRSFGLIFRAARTSWRRKRGRRATPKPQTPTHTANPKQWHTAKPKQTHAAKPGKTQTAKPKCKRQTQLLEWASMELVSIAAGTRPSARYLIGAVGLCTKLETQPPNSKPSTRNSQATSSVF